MYGYHTIPTAFVVLLLNSGYKVLSMSRLGGAGAVAQLVADIPLQSVEVITTNYKYSSLLVYWHSDYLIKKRLFTYMLFLLNY